MDQPELGAPEQQPGAVQGDSAIDLVVFLRYQLLVGDFLLAGRIERFEFGSSRDHVGKVEILEEHEREARLAVAPRLHLQLQRRARTHGVFDVDAGLLADRRDQIGLPESLKVGPRNGVYQRERAGRARWPWRERTGGERSDAAAEQMPARNVWLCEHVVASLFAPFLGIISVNRKRCAPLGSICSMR